MPEELRYWHIGAKNPTVRVDIPEGLTLDQEFQIRSATRNLAEIALGMRGVVEPIMLAERKSTSISGRISRHSSREDDSRLQIRGDLI
jgi:hypothetical protein